MLSDSGMSLRRPLCIVNSVASVVSADWVGQAKAGKIKSALEEAPIFPCVQSRLTGQAAALLYKHGCPGSCIGQTKDSSLHPGRGGGPLHIRCLSCPAEAKEEKAFGLFTKEEFQEAFRKRDRSDWPPSWSEDEELMMLDTAFHALTKAAENLQTDEPCKEPEQLQKEGGPLQDSEQLQKAGGPSEDSEQLQKAGGPSEDSEQLQKAGGPSEDSVQKAGGSSKDSEASFDADDEASAASAHEDADAKCSGCLDDEASEAAEPEQDQQEQPEHHDGAKPEADPEMKQACKNSGAKKRKRRVKAGRSAP